MQSPQGNRLTHNQRAGYAILALLALIVVGVLVNPQQPSAPTPDTPSRTETCVMGQDFVSQRLKSPGSAQYPLCKDTDITDLGDGNWRMAGYVDSQNGFGALLRTPFVLQMHYQGQQHWRLTDLQFVAQ